VSYIAWIRQHVGHMKIPLVFASACVRDDAGRVLWQHRSDFGFWGMPGGSLELNETLKRNKSPFASSVDRWMASCVPMATRRSTWPGKNQAIFRPQRCGTKRWSRTWP